MAQYDIVAVARANVSEGSPTLTELGPLVAGNLSYTDAIDAPGGASMTLNTETIADDVKTRLRSLDTLPMEVRIYRDGSIVFAGPVIGYDIAGQGALNLVVPDLRYYLYYFLVTTDKTWTTTEQFTIARELVSDWQGLTYGDFGIDTSAVTTSGITRSFSIPGAEEPVNVYDPLLALGQAEDGFDFWIDPGTRELELAHPERGSDLSASVFLERGISSDKIKVSVAPNLLASEIFLTATSGGSALTSTFSNPDLRSAFGRTGFAVAEDNVDNQALADDLAEAHALARGEAFFQPGPELFPVVGAGVDDFGVGDTVTYSYDAGLGTQTDSYRVIKRKVAVEDNGTETMTVAFDKKAVIAL